MISEFFYFLFKIFVHLKLTVMSLNEIYNNPADNSTKSWQNYRINNLNIRENFNINTTGADVGDVLQLDSGLNPTWVPFTNTSTNSVDRVLGVFTSTSVPLVETQLDITTISSSGPIFTLVGGKIVVDRDCALMFTANFTSIPTTSSMPVFSLKKGSGLSEITLCNVSPYRTTLAANTPFTQCSCLSPVKCIAGDTLYIKYKCTDLSSTTPTQFIPAESSISIIRLA